MRRYAAAALSVFLLVLGCARTVPAPVPVVSTQTITLQPVSGIMVQAIVIVDGERFFPPITVMPDMHNTFQLKVTAPAGIHSISVSTVDADGVISVEPLRQVRF